MLSTMRPLNRITKDDGKKKPAIFKFYDFSKGGTDEMDQRIAKYSVKPKSPKWTRVAFSYVLDTARINSLSIYAMTFDLSEVDLDTFDVIWALAESLVRPFVEARSLNGLSTKTRLKISLLLGTKPQTQTTAPATPSGLKQRCHLCLKEIAGQEGYKQAKDRMTKVKTACSHCQKACCSKHFSVICTDCDV